jgi:hypothetical protein
LVMRAPGDALRVRLNRDSLVFAPGETFQAVIEPHALPTTEGGRARLKIQLLGGGKEIWSQQHEVRADHEAKIPLEIPLPREEGVYDVVIAAVNNPHWSQAVRQPLNWKRTIAERRVQLLVLSSQRLAAPRGDRDFTPLVEIDPANPRWFEKLNKLPQLQLAKNRLPRLWKGPLGNGCAQIQQHPLGDVVRLRPNVESPDVSWEAYWLPIVQPGRPHVLEVDYPSDVSQTLGVSVVEPNAAGAMMPISVDSGVDCEAASDGTGASPQWRRHRLIFWPRTNSPLLLITNGRDRAPACYGKIRVLSGSDRLPQALPDRGATNGRLLAAYMDRPLIPENFAGSESLDSWSGRSLDDWWTFYESGSRLTNYLHHAGYNGLMLAVLADGSTIYPSRLLAPTPRYDTGAFFSTGQDPVRKDVLEMLLRLFDREGLQMIPTVEFAAPLPELESLRRAGGPEAEGVEWIGPEGLAWCDATPAQRGLAPYYNILHPRVQQAMLGVLQELAKRYAQHPSFRGLGVRLSADGYAQLPGPDWGLDDATIARFERDAKLRIPGEGSQRFAQRAAFLAQEPQRRTWLEWRAAQLAAFYRRAQELLASVRPDSCLYLGGAGMFSGADLEAELRPTLPRKINLADTLLRVGINARYYQDQPRRLVLLRPDRISPRTDLSARAIDLELGQLSEVDRYFRGNGVSGSLFFHPPREVRIESFDAKSPFKSSETWLISQPTPSGDENRRRFVHSLATLDAQIMIDGGWLLPMGQEDSVRDLAAAYRALPPIRFHTVGERSATDLTMPVVFRAAAHQGRTYLYAVNDTPFSVTARLRVEAQPGCRMDELSGNRKIAPLQADGAAGTSWEVSLAAYDLVAVQFSEPNVRFSNPQTAWPGGVDAAMSSRIRQLGVRAAALRNPPPLDVLANPGFERPASGDGPVPDWTAATRNGASVHLDKTQPHGGKQSVRLASTGTVACLVSRPLSIHSTGRLSMSVWLRVADVNHQPPLRLAIEGKHQGRDYYRFAPVGQPVAPGQPSAPLASEWKQYVFQVDDLPLEGLSPLRVRFDLMGAGEVLIDDVQVFELAFSKPELLELSKLITLADVKRQNGQIGECLRLLDGYWPKFLEENVALPAAATPPESIATKPHPSNEKPPDRSGWLNRVKDFVPESLRF